MLRSSEWVKGISTYYKFAFTFAQLLICLLHILKIKVSWKFEYKSSNGKKKKKLWLWQTNRDISDCKTHERGGTTPRFVTKQILGTASSLPVWYKWVRTKQIHIFLDHRSRGKSRRAQTFIKMRLLTLLFNSKAYVLDSSSTCTRTNPSQKHCWNPIRK